MKTPALIGISLIQALWPGLCWAAFHRPEPLLQPQSAEKWFLGAAVAMVVALYAVHRLVMRK